MIKLKKTATYLFLILVLACGLFAGCKDKYADLKVFCDMQEQGVTLYIGEQDKQDTADIIFTVEGAGEDISTKLIFSFEENSETKYVDIVDTYHEGNTTTVTVKAISGGETTLVALTEEGGKSCKVKIKSVISAKSMEVNNLYKGIVVAGGQPLVLNTSNIIKFTPENTTENKIAYSLKNLVNGITLTESGMLSVAQDVTASSVTIVAKNVLANNLPDVEFDVKIIENISDDNVSVISKGEKIDKIELVSNFDTENTISLDVDVVTREDFDVSFSFVDKNDTSNHNVTFVDFINKQGSNAVIIAKEAGSCWLKIDIVVSDIVAKTVLIPVDAVELAKVINVNGNTEDYAENIYTTYNNNLGQEFKVEVGNAFSAERTYFIVIDSQDVDKVKIVNDDKSLITPRVKTGDTYSDVFDILQNGSKFYVTGLSANSNCSISVIATSTFEYQTKTMITINLTTLLGAESISINYQNEEIASKTVFVEVGKTVTLNYQVLQENASLIGLELTTLVSDEQCFSYEINNGIVSITGLKANKVSAKLTLPNLVESELFVIYVFKTINNVYASVESPLTSNKIADVKYGIDNQLQSFVMTLGATTKLSFNYQGSLYDLTCQIVDDTNSQIATITKDGLIYSKNVGKTVINVVAKTFVTNGNDIEIDTIQFSIDLTVYIPVKNISLSSSVLNICYMQSLNQIRYENGDYIANLSLILYPNNVYLNDENLHITWKSSNEEILIPQLSDDKLNKVFFADSGDVEHESSIEYIEVFVTYYGTTLSAKCIVNIENPVMAQGLIVNINGKTDSEIYFDYRKVNDGIQTAKINTTVYPANTTDKTVIYTGYDKSIVTVAQDGTVTMVGTGTTYITVTAQDSTYYSGINSRFDSKIIKVIVADGKTKQTAFRINDETSFLSIKTDIIDGNNNYYYYFANDVYLTNKITSFGDFAGNIDGKNYILYNLAFDDASNAFIFNKQNGAISNLGISTYINREINANSTISILANENNGTIENVAVMIDGFNVKNLMDGNTLVLSGLVATNNGTISGSYVNSNLSITGENFAQLTIGMISAINNGKIYGNNNNYAFVSDGYQNFDVLGSINTTASATTSYIGAVAGTNTGTIGSNNNGPLSGKGLATNLAINTPNLNNVGGIAGQSNGTICNALVYGNILANENVGGVAGQVTAGEIQTSIVELYKNAFVDDEYYSISGSDKVGGLVGQLSGKISNSYVLAYNNKSSIISQNFVGGLVGYGVDSQIAMSSANVCAKGDIVGGLIGHASNVAVANCYSRGELIGSTIAGKILGEVAFDSTLTNSYSTIVDGNVKTNSTSTSYFVGRIDSGALTISNSYHLSGGTTDESNVALKNDTDNNRVKTSDELKDINTYTGWSIGNDLYGNNIWCLNNAKNDEYPIILYGSFLQYKTTASQLFVNTKSGVNIADNIIVLSNASAHNLLDLFSISTDVNSNTSILVKTNVEGILNSNILTNNTTIKSTTEQIVTLTFMLATNPAIQTSKTVLFVKEINHFEFDKTKITIKVGESEKITGYVFDDFGNLLPTNNYYFGAEWANANDDYLLVSNSERADGKIYFQNGSVFKAEKSNVGSITLNVKLYKKIGDKYINIFGNNEKSVELKIVTSKGATDIDIDKKQVSMTVINDLTLTVTIKTDNSDEILYLLNNNYINIISDGTKFKWLNDNYQNNSNAIFNLKLLKYEVDNDEATTTKTFTLELSFVDGYKNGSLEFAKEISTVLKFISKNGDIEHTIDLTLNAKPQNLLKIDMMHFPAGRQTTGSNNGSTTVTYNPSEIPNNTLVPGQIGLLVIDAYPQYAFFDEMQVTSTSAGGTNINFIQVAYNKDGSGYVELKPNAEIISNGIVLSKQSNYIKDANNVVTITYDGKLYVKTLVPTNVGGQTTFTVTVSAYIYQRDDNGQVIYGTDGKPATKDLSLQKNFEIVVSPNPEVKIVVAQNDAHQKIVEVDGERKQCYLIAKGGSVSIETITKNFVSNVKYTLNGNATFSNGNLYVNDDATLGKTITLQAYATKTINGMEERYYSDILYFVVVDYILTDVQCNNTTIKNGEKTPLEISLTGLGTANEDFLKALNQIVHWKIQETTGLAIKSDNDDNKLYLDPAKVGEYTLLLNFNFIYIDGKLTIETSNLDNDSTNNINRQYKIVVVQVDSLENPLPINSISDFYNMTAGNDYILLTDLEFGDTTSSTSSITTTKDAYTPFDLNANSFDGNCHTITIKAFNTKGAETEYLGLFSNISQSTVVKNMFVDYQDVGTIAPNTKNSVVFGGLSAQNQGVISNSVVTYKTTKGDATLTIGGTDNTIGAFVGINEGLITYSTAQGSSALTYTENGNNKELSDITENKNFTIISQGNVAGFVCTNSNLIANCQTRYLGLNNTTSVNSKTMTAGFACTNSGEIYYSSVVGQLYYDAKNQQNSIRALSTTDERLNNISHNFAILQSNGNVAGFVYKNSGKIKDTYSNIPMKTQARTSGFVFENSSGSIWTSYTVSYFDEKTTEDNTAHTAFIGTNELGEVLNDSLEIKYCYYISNNNYEEFDSKFSQVATAILLSQASTANNYVGFDINPNDDQAVWATDLDNYPLPALKSQYNNDLKLSTNNFQRVYSNKEQDSSGVILYKYYFKKTEGSADNPYLISSARQLLNIVHFNKKDPYEEYEVPSIYIRLINNLDFSEISQNDLQKLQKYIFVGDFDGNGLTISGLRVGDSGNNDSFGLFKQIGSFIATNTSKGDIPKTTFRSLTIQVDEFAKSTSTFAGILSGIVTNTKLKNIVVNATNLTVLGNNVVGGVAGIILGESSLYNVSSNVSVESAYLGTENGNYQDTYLTDKVAKDYTAKLDLEQLNTDIKTDKDNKEKAEQENESNNTANYEKKFTSIINYISIDGNKSNCQSLSYAGGIAGIVDITQKDNNVAYDNISFRTANIKLAKVSDEITITAEKVGGLFGYAGKDVYIANSQFVVSTSDNQRLKGYYIAGGLIGENYGLLAFSKVEIDSNFVDNYDNNLTNRTGENLFNAENTYPVYIGGLVGINYGGYISSCYSKTNVVHYNASYVGGLIGYATNNGLAPTNSNDPQEINNAYRSTILEQVYTTGNVFAGANIAEKIQLSNETDTNGINTVKYLATSKNVAGGIFGKLDITVNDLQKNSESTEYYFNFKGVLGLNGFYKPSGYTVDQSLNDSGVKYGMLASGFEGTVTLSSGDIAKTTYSPVVSAFAGEISIKTNDIKISDDEIKINFGSPNTSDIYYNYMFTPFAYNASNITASACASSDGKPLAMFAKFDTFKINDNDVILTNESLELNGYNSYDYEGNIITIDTTTTQNKQVANGDNGFIVKIASNNAYLLYRSQDVNGKLGSSTINYSNFVQDLSGIYINWSPMTWKAQSPVYPKFVERDTSGYIYIENEYDLTHRINSSYTNYLLVNDIYLTKPLIALRSFTGNFESAIRSDGAGIDGNQYYGIYNINLTASLEGNLTAVGIFANAEKATIKNINFVFGTRIQDPTLTYDNTDDNPDNDFWNDSNYDDLHGIKVNSNAQKSVSVGSIIGYAKDSTITNCNVYYDYASGSTISVTGNYDNLYVGGLVGSAENCQVSGSFNYGDVIVEKTTTGTGSDAKTTITSTFTSQNMNSPFINIGSASSSVNVAGELCVGGLLGKINGTITSGVVSTIKDSNIYVNNNPATCNAYIGGLYGSVLDNTSNSATLAINPAENSNIGVNVQGTYNTVNIGGVAGNIDNANLSMKGMANSLTITTTATTNELYVGGAIGYVSTNGATVDSIALTNCTINAYATVNGTNSGEQGVCDLGGFVGYAETLTANNCKVDKITINTNTSTVKNSTSIGGFGGDIKLDNSTNCYVGDVTIGLKNANLGSNVYVGGFAGRGIVNLKNGFAKGEINLPSSLITSDSTSQNLFAGGFVGQFQKRTDENSNLIMCFADVEITANTTSENLHMAGFANIDITQNNTENRTPSVSLTNCVSLGNLIYTKGAYNGYATGFVDYVTDNVNTCYSMSTLKLISGTNKNISTDYLDNKKNSTSSINFSYNLSGSVYYNGGSQNNIKNYNDLASSVRSLISDDSYIKSKYGSTTGETFNFTQGTKINPVLLENSATLTENSYYYATNTFVVDINDKSVNLIANDYTKGVLLTLSGPATISKNAFVSGFAFNVNGLNYINQNNGYLFNCLALSQKDDDGTFNESNFATVGFVNENTGLINACGTTANIKYAADSETACGFVNTNSGIIANSFANGIIHNITSSGTNAGFVGTNSGSILNSYASTTMFNRDTLTGQSYDNCCGFVQLNSGTLSNCLYDSSSAESVGQTLAGANKISHENLTNEKDSSGNYVSSLYNLNIKSLDCDPKINYGICSTISHKNYLTNDIEDKDAKTYTSHIKNIAQLQNLMSYLNTNESNLTEVNIYLLTNLDGTLLNNRSFDSLSLSNQNSSISLKTIIKNVDNYKFVIYNIELTKALLSAQNVTLQDVGLFARLYNNAQDYRTTNATGMFVGSATTLTATNCYAVLKNNVTVTSSTFGILAGSVTNCYITNTFTSGDFIVNSTSSANIGHMIGKIDNTATIFNVFTNGTITIEKDEKTTSMYVGGMIGYLGASEKYDSNYSYVLANSYSNVTIKNYALASNKTITAGAFAGYANIISSETETKYFGTDKYFEKKYDAMHYAIELNAKKAEFMTYNICTGSKNSELQEQKPIFGPNGTIIGGGYTVTAASVTHIKTMLNLIYDPNISLVDYYFGNQTECKTTAENALFTYNPFDKNTDGTAKTYTYSTANHFPLQSVFANNAVVYGLLNINDNNETGSRMSPIGKNAISDFDKDKYYYLSNDINAGSYESIYNVIIYGKGHKVTGSDYTVFRVIESSIVTNVKINNIVFADQVTNSLIKNCVASGSNTVLSSGFINSANNVYLLNCQVNLSSLETTSNATTVGGLIGFATGTTYLQNCQVNLSRLTASAKTVGGMIGQANGTTYIQNPVVSISKISLTHSGTDSKTWFGGIIGTPAKNSTTYIQNPTISKLELASSSASYLEFGGISAYANSDSTIDLMGDVTINGITIDRSNNTTSYYLGLLYGNVNITKTLFNSSFNLTSNNDNIALTFTCSKTDKDEDGVSLDSKCNIYAGTFGRLMGDGATVNLSNLDIAKPINFDITGGYYYTDLTWPFFHSNKAQSVYVGGIAGIAQGSNTYTNAKLSNSIYVTLEYSRYNYIGGIVGKVTESACFTNFTQSGNVCVTDNNAQANTYVGGFAGYSDTTGTVSGTSTGLVAAQSAATSAQVKTKVYDARTFDFDRKYRYFDKEVYIPLAVGGIYGYYIHKTDANLSSVTKTQNQNITNSVRALLTNDNSSSGLKDSVYYIKNGDEIPYEEGIQCRAGAFAGLFNGTGDYENQKTNYVTKINKCNLNISAGYNTGSVLNMGSYDIKWGDSYQKNYNMDAVRDALNRSEISKSNYSSTNIFSERLYQDEYNDRRDNYFWKDDNNSYLLNEYDKSDSLVFAGYVYNGTTYNRSFWMSCETKSHLKYTATILEHWAGSKVGACVAK